MRRFFIGMLMVLAAALWGCGGDVGSGPDGDGPETDAPADGDTIVDGDAEADPEPDGPDPDPTGTDGDTAAETETADGDPDGGNELPVDGDVESEMAEESESFDQPETPEESEPPLDGDEEAVEGDADGDTTEQEPETQQCDPSTSPLRAWRETALGRFTPDGWAYEGAIRDRCDTDGIFIAGAAGMKVSLRFTPLSLYGRVVVTEIAAASGRRDGEVIFEYVCREWPCPAAQTEFDLPYTGEYAVVVTGRNYQNTGSYAVSAACLSGCDRRFTRFPIVLLHGMAGFNSILNIYDYFTGVHDDLEDLGYDVYKTEVAMFNDSDWRARELEGQLLTILRDTGARKLDLIAHSQGGLDGRHFISGMGHGGEVAVLAMVATPNHGSPLGDVILGNVQGVSRDVIAGIFDAFVNLIDASESDIEASLASVAVQTIVEQFNPAHPDDPRVRYWSWGGMSGCGMLDFWCRDDMADEYLLPVLRIPWEVLKSAGPPEQYFGENDGIVPHDSAIWGEWQGTLYADHADEIGVLESGPFDHKALYRSIAGKMAAENF